jgi:hypothetical protein
MHAIRLHEFCPADNLRYEEVPDLTPSAEQVRIGRAGVASLGSLCGHP